MSARGGGTIVSPEQTISEFWQRRTQSKDRYEASRFHQNNRLGYDCALIRNYLDRQTRVLDLGCGSGLIEEQLASEVALIHAIDKYPEFMETAPKADNVTYAAGDVTTFFEPAQQYDLILIFGVVCYLSDEAMLQMLEHCLNMLTSTGTIIIKGQWGIEKRKIIHHYSEELKTMYYADYRQVDETRRIFEEHGASVEVVDLYPPEQNRWPDTHEYAFILKCSR